MNQGKPVFETDLEYQKFRESYCVKIKPVLDRQREARRLSEQKARRQLVK